MKSSKYLMILISLATLVSACSRQAPIPSSPAADSPASPMLRSGRYQELDGRYTAIQRRFDNGDLSGDDLRVAFRDFYVTDRSLGPKFDEWVAQYPQSYVARVARGIYYKKVGFEARGTKYIKETSQSQIDAMTAAFEKSVADLRASLTMGPKPFLSYFHLLDIGMAVGAKENLRELFDRAIALDPSSYAVRLKYMVTLEPRWGGSMEEMRNFYAECQRAGLNDAQNKELQGMLAQEQAWLAQR